MTLGMKAAITILVISAPIFWICVGLSANTVGPVGAGVATAGTLAFAACVVAVMVFVLALIWGF